MSKKVSTAVKKIPGLGDIVKDSLTGYVGLVYGTIRHYNGCFQLKIARKLKKGFSDEEFETIDIARLEYQPGGIGLVSGINYDWPYDRIDIGDEVEDIVSGFKGKVSICQINLSGSMDCEVQPAVDKTGNVPYPKRFNINYLKVTKKVPRPEKPLTAEQHETTKFE